MSDSKKTSSPYVVHENRSLDQWKVTELKEELKRRKLITKGLKDDLVKRLDEAIRAEMTEANQTNDNGVNDIDQPEVPSDDATVEPIVAEETTIILDDDSAKNKSLDEDNITEKVDKIENLEKDNITENLDSEDRANIVSEVMVSKEHNVEINKGEKSNLHPEDEESKPELQSAKEEAVNPNSSDIGSQVVEVSQVKSDSISIDNSLSITEKNELKDNVIADDVKLELDVKPEMAQPSKTESVVVDEPCVDTATTEEKGVNIAESMDIYKKNDSVDVGSPEKLNLDRSSGDDSMEEDVLESKQIDSSDKTEVPLVKEDEHVDVMVEDTPVAKHTDGTKDKGDPVVASTKRKLHDQEAATNSEVVKRQRRWNSESLKVPEQQNTNSSVSTTPKDVFQASMKHSFSRSDSLVSHEEPKERIVPPSSKPSTASLRIDRFLRPFTLKAVQELLGKTGTVVSFWMDHIKTHCYVTYASVEEAVETRNALYNLQWPANGGRLLIAEFVDPSEVKSRTEAPLPSPVTTPVGTTKPALSQLPPAATQPPAPPPQQLPPPPLPLPPPPPLSLPPPPPLLEKVEPPIVTLDDLFRKTRATPRIYYLPLTKEQVAAKLKGLQVLRLGRNCWSRGACLVIIDTSDVVLQDSPNYFRPKCLSQKTSICFLSFYFFLSFRMLRLLLYA